MRGLPSSVGTQWAIIAQRPHETRLSGAPRWRGGHHPMGDATSGPVRLSFNPQLRVEFRGATVTSDAGLLLPRELDERLGLSALIKRVLRQNAQPVTAVLQPVKVRSRCPPPGAV